MGTFFILLSFVALIVLAVGLVKPSVVKLASRRKVGMWYGGAFIVLLILGVAVTPTDHSATTSVSVPVQNKTTTPVASDTKVVPNTPSAVPLTDEAKIEQAVRSVLQQSSSHISYIKSDLSTDEPPAPKGSKYLVVTLDTDAATFWDDEAIITETGKLASQIFQKVFQTTQNTYDVSVLYDGDTTDQYGNTKSSLLVSFTMDRPLYTKINWAGFADTQNDKYLCAFLREQFNTMSKTDREGSVVGCAVLPGNLMKAENKIETSNSQFRDIPQYR